MRGQMQMRRLMQGRPSRRPTARAGVLCASFLIIGALLSFVNAAPARASTFSAVADTYVDSSQPNGNYGTKSAIQADASPVRIGYVRFDVQGVGSQSSAQLRLRAATSNSLGFSIHTVGDVTWGETTTTYATRPALGTLIASSGAVTSGTWYAFDVSSAVSGDGSYSFAITSTSTTSLKISSRETSSGPQLLVPGPSSPSPYTLSRDGSTYTAASPNGTTFTGSLKFVVESAVADLRVWGGGTIAFGAGVFDLGSDFFDLDGISNVEFAGQGIDLTFIQNVSSLAKDTEPFNFGGADHIVIRDMTISAGGPARSTSDAIDFDRGNHSLVERVKIVASRARGIVFDGKGSGWTADDNVVRDCVISNVPGDGIELLAANRNEIRGCTITDTGIHGIQINKASLSAATPNKKSNDNLIVGNTIDQAGEDGINVISGDRNQIVDNVVTNSSDNVSGRDGIRITSFDSVTCDDNVVDGNVSTDNQAVKTQRYGLHIASSLCNRTVVGTNDLSGNLTAPLRDVGTGTIYGPDEDPPTQPTGLSATPVSSSRIDLSWTESTDNVGVTGYTIYRDDTFLDTVGGSTTTYQDTTLSPDTTYKYEVDAFDAADLHSIRSDPAFATTPPPSTLLVVTPEADTYADAGNPTTNYGSSSTLRTDASPLRVIYLRFNVTGVTTSVTKATMRMFASSGSSVGHDVSDVADDTWLELGMTYENAPAIGSLVASSGSFSSGTWIEVDVTSLVSGNGMYSLAVTTTSSTAIAYASRESANDPQLVIEMG